MSNVDLPHPAADAPGPAARRVALVAALSVALGIVLARLTLSIFVVEPVHSPSGRPMHEVMGRPPQMPARIDQVSRTWGVPLSLLFASSLGGFGVCLIRLPHPVKLFTAISFLTPSLVFVLSIFALLGAIILLVLIFIDAIKMRDRVSLRFGVVALVQNLGGFAVVIGFAIETT